MARVKLGIGKGERVERFCGAVVASTAHRLMPGPKQKWCAAENKSNCVVSAFWIYIIPGAVNQGCGI